MFMSCPLTIWAYTVSTDIFCEAFPVKQSLYGRVAGWECAVWGRIKKKKNARHVLDTAHDDSDGLVIVLNGDRVWI